MLPLYVQRKTEWAIETDTMPERIGIVESGICVLEYISSHCQLSRPSLYLSPDYQLRRIWWFFFLTLQRRTLTLFLQHSGARSSTQSGTNTPIDRSYTVNGVYIARVWRWKRDKKWWRRKEGKRGGKDEMRASERGTNSQTAPIAPMRIGASW